MYIPSLKELSKIGDSRYTLVIVTAKRSRELIDNSKPIIETSSTKPVTIALEEVVEGKIKYKRPDIKGVK